MIVVKKMDREHDFGIALWYKFHSIIWLPMFDYLDFVQKISTCWTLQRNAQIKSFSSKRIMHFFFLFPRETETQFILIIIYKLRDPEANYERNIQQNKTQENPNEVSSDVRPINLLKKMGGENHGLHFAPYMPIPVAGWRSKPEKHQIRSECHFESTTKPTVLFTVFRTLVRSSEQSKHVIAAPIFSQQIPML